MRPSILTNEEEQRIAETVAAMEERTGGEIAVAVIPESDDYGFRELLFSVILGVVAFSSVLLFAPAVESFLAGLFWGYEGWILAAAAGFVALAVAGVAYLLAQIPAVDRAIVPGKVREEAVRRRALRHFVEAGVHDTKDRTGVLLFVSMMERRVELVADTGIAAKVPEREWKEIVATLTSGIGRGETATALVAAVEGIGAILADRVERRTDDMNELKNRPTQLESGS
ncbi:MAG: TPM domain-containing protein [Alkalispirochaeta sp.]